MAMSYCVQMCAGRVDGGGWSNSAKRSRERMGWVSQVGSLTKVDCERVIKGEMGAAQSRDGRNGRVGFV